MSNKKGYSFKSKEYFSVSAQYKAEMKVLKRLEEELRQSFCLDEPLVLAIAAQDKVVQALRKKLLRFHGTLGRKNAA